jgi:acyl-CoA thioester hydrolase
MNNARYFELIDTAVNAHLAEATGVDIRHLPAVGVVAEVSCRYFREVGYPDPIDLGLVVERIGTSSVIYRIGIFQGDAGQPEDEAAAEGRFVHVYVTNTDPVGGRPTTAIPGEIRAVLEPLVTAPAG